MKKVLLLLIILGVFFGFRPSAAADVQSVIADTYTDLSVPDTNLDGRQLLTNYAVWPAFKASSTAYIQFDVSGTQGVGGAALELAIVQNHLEGGSSATLSLVGVTDDSWQENRLTASDAVTLTQTAELASATVAGDATVVVFNSAELTTFIREQRLGDGVASFAIKVSAQSGGSLFGTLVLGDSDNGNAATVDITNTAPLAISLRGWSVDSLLQWPLIFVLILLIVSTGVLQRKPAETHATIHSRRTQSILSFHGRARLPQRSLSRRSSRLLHLLIVIIFVIGSLFGLTRLTAAEDCTTAVPVILSAQREGNNVLLSWNAGSGNDAYYIYGLPDTPTIDITTLAPLDMIEATTEWIHTDALLGANSWVYVVVAVSYCDDSTAPTAPYGVRVADLTPSSDDFTLVTNAFGGNETASAFSQKQDSLDLLLKYDAENELFTAFVPPNIGNNFELKPGEPIFVSAETPIRGSAASIFLSGDIQPTDFPLEEGVFNGVSVPMQREDLTNSDMVLASLGCADTFHFWNTTTQLFDTYQTGDLLPVDIYTPFFVEPANNLCKRWPADSGFVAFAQAQEARSRSVYLRWHTQDVGSSFDIHRRVQGGSWSKLTTVGPVANANALQTAVSGSILDALAKDMRPISQTTDLILDDIFAGLVDDAGKQLFFGNRHHEVAIAMGSGYLDSSAVVGVDYEYYIVPTTQTVPFGATPYLRPICVDASPSALPALNLVERNIAYVPTGLGEIPTSRSSTGAERYDFDLAQTYRPMHGRVHLDWTDMKPAPSGSGAWDCWDDVQLSVQGFEVDRRGALTGNAYESANDVSPGGVRLLAGNGSTAKVPQSGTVQLSADFKFQDPLIDLYPLATPATLFSAHDYRICAIDWLGNQLGCETSDDIPVRELDTPRAPAMITPTINAAHTQLTVTWTFSDVAETGTPLHFYVSRSESLTAPLSTWDAVGDTSGTSFVVNKGPQDEGKLFWYAVQARDNAGNWSPASNPYKAAFYPRTAPPFNPAFGTNCEDNVMPLTLTGIDSQYKQVALYRGFDASGPFKLAQRIWISQTNAILTEQYVPTYATDIYYKVEAIDGHGNVSPAVTFCARKVTGNAPLPPEVGELSHEGNVLSFPLVDASTPGDIVITRREPGHGGMTTTMYHATTGGGGTANAGTLDWGASAEIDIVRNDPLTDQPSDPTTRQVRRVNNFLGSDRHMTDLGPLQVGRINQTRIFTLTNDCGISDCNLAGFARPFVTVFRKAKQGNWMQISPMLEITSLPDQPWVVETQVEETPEVDYSYTVLAFSPDSYEVLGTWRTVTLPAQISAEIGTIATFDYDPQLPLPPSPTDPNFFPGCTVNGLQPSELGFPEHLILAEGWTLEVDAYYEPLDPICPGMNLPAAGSQFDGVYGTGILRSPNANNALQVQTTFNDFSIDISTSDANGHLRVDFTNPIAVSHGLVNQLIGVGFQRGDGFLPKMVAGKYAMTLPNEVRMRDFVSGEWRTSLHAYLASPNDSNFSFPQQQIGGEYIDENLPWLLFSELAQIDVTGISFPGLTMVQPRWFAPPTFGIVEGENNLSYLLTDYNGSNVAITSAGLTGNFTTTNPIDYVTSLPATMHVQAQGATVNVANSQISGGSLTAASVMLEMYKDRNVLDYIVAGASNSVTQTTPFDPPDLRAWARQDMNDLRERTPLDLSAATLPIGAQGKLLGDMTLNSPVQIGWTNYSAQSATYTLYLADVSFPDSPVGTLQPTGVVAPMPAHVAWQPIPLGGPDLHPGLNLIDNSGAFGYSCFNPTGFHGGLDLYVRRGGVSDSVSGDVAGQTASYGDFSAEFGTMDLTFLDNYLLIPPSNLVFTIALPYPSNIQLPLTVKNIDLDCNADLVAPPNTTVTHDYWNYTHDVTGAKIDRSANPNSLTLFGKNSDVVALADASGNVVKPAVHTTWYGNGDYKQGKLAERDNRFTLSGMTYDLTKITLSSYYSTPGDTNSLPTAPTLNVSGTISTLPADILDNNGKLTSQSLKDCSQYPQNTGVVGCGLILFDGNGVTDYFGEIEQKGTTTSTAGTQGTTPVAVTTKQKDQTFAAMLQEPILGWEWATGEKLMSYIMPIKILSNRDGGAVVGVARDFTLLPDIDGGVLGKIELPELAKGDIGFVVSFKKPTNGAAFDDNIGVYTGFATSQAAIRALAASSPTITDTTKWEQVEPEANKWMKSFGYSPDNDRTNKNDPLDLAKTLWITSSWGTKSFTETYSVLNGSVKILGMSVITKPVYGIAHWNVGKDLKDSGVQFGANLGDVLFVKKNGEWQLDMINVGTPIEIREGGNAKDDLIVSAEWLSFQYNRDGELVLSAEKIRAGVMGGPSDNYISAMLLIGTKAGNERIEGGLLISALDFGEVKVKDVGAVLGAGRYNSEPVLYIGIKAEGKFDSVTVGGGFLIGNFTPTSLGILKVAGFDKAVARMQGNGDLPQPYFGMYANLYGGGPIYTSAIVEVGGYFELETYLVQTQKGFVGGGSLVGGIYGKTPIISGRGQIRLALDVISGGSAINKKFIPKEFKTKPIGNRNCKTNTTQCTTFSGEIWVAVGIGFCEPETWTSWNAKWWGDGGCYTMGLLGGLNYLDKPQGGGDQWLFDYALAAE